MKMKTVTPFIFFVLSCLPACGGGGADEGYLVLQIENARLSVQSASIARSAGGEEDSGRSDRDAGWLKALELDRFRVEVAGPGIETPIVAEAPSSEGQIEVLGIPAGADRTILIEAFSHTGSVLKRRIIEGVVISPGVVAPMKVRLRTIPVFLKPPDGSVVLSGQFHIAGFGEPGAALRVESSSATANLSLGLSAGMPLTPAVSTGLFEFAPSDHLPGKQKLTVTDEETGESSSISVVVVDGNRPGSQFVSAGAPGLTAGPLGNSQGVNFQLVMNALLAGAGERE